MILSVVPALGVEEIRAIDGDGAVTVLAPDDYAFDVVDGSVELINPVAEAASYEIDFTVGYGPSGLDVPQPLRQAIRLLVTHWFENRSAATLGDAAIAMPLGYRELVAPYRRMALC